MRKSFDAKALLLTAALIVIFFAFDARWSPSGETRTVRAASDPAPVGDATVPGRQEPVSGAAWFGLMLKKGDNGEPLVSAVFPGGPAAFGGLRKGDQVRQVAGRAVASIQAVVSAIEKEKPGEPVEVVVQRGSNEVKLTVRAESLDDFHRRYTREMLRRDPRHPDYGKHPGVSRADVSLEVNRRLFEQHERLERSLQQVLVELAALRKQVDALAKK